MRVNSNISRSNIYHIIFKHRSIRQYTGDAVPPKIINNICKAATRASSSGNMQAYSMIITKDTQLKEKLFKAHFEQKFVLQAPILMTFCADFHRMRLWLKMSNAPGNFDNPISFMIAAIDAILAAQNAALAAEAHGLGICFLGTTLANCSEIAQILNCPDHVVPVVGFTLGYPLEKPELRDRLPLRGLVHQDCYHDYTEADLESTYEKKAELGWKRYMAITELRQKIITAEAENLAQIYTKVKYTRSSHQEYSKTLLKCLKEKGFLNFDPNHKELSKIVANLYKASTLING